MRFGIDDEDEFHETRDRLLDELADRLGDQADPEVIGNVGLLLDWRWGYSTGELDRFDPMELAEYLLEWCPRKVSTDPEGYRPIVEGVRAWILHLALTNQWSGGPVQPLLRQVDKLEPKFIDAMADPSNFGLAKGLFMGPGFAGADLDLDDPDSLQEAMDRFNAQSLEERRAITDPLIQRMASGGAPTESELAALIAEHTIELPKVEAPDPALVASQAAAAPLLAQLEAVADHLGAGKALTQTGNPKLVDARAMVELFGTDDVADYSIGEWTKELTSANELPHLQLLLAVAEDAGALVDDGRKLRPHPGWAEIDPVARCEALLASYLAFGPIESRSPTEFMARLDRLLDDGILHWMVPVYLGEQVPADELIERSAEVVRGEPQTVPRAFEDESSLVGLISWRVAWALDALERCGVINWTGTELVDVEWGPRQDRVGGTVTITALGRQLLAPHLLEVGYRARTMIDLRDASATDAIDELDEVLDLEPEGVWASWRPEDDAAVKTAELCEALQGATTPARRLGAVALLAQAPPEQQQRVLPPLLDGPLAAYAVMALDPGMAAELGSDTDGSTLSIDGRSVEQIMGELAPELALPPMVDMLALQLEHDDEAFIEHLAEMTDDEQLLDLVTTMWRVPGPESRSVLEAIGREHPTKAVAKAARKAVIQHRTRHGAS